MFTFLQGITASLCSTLVPSSASASCSQASDQTAQGEDMPFARRKAFPVAVLIFSSLTQTWKNY